MIARLLYQNPRILLLVICVIGGAGAAAIFTLPRLEDPVLGRRVGVISVIYPGADSRRVESLVAVRFEQALAGVDGIRQIRTSSRAGVCSIVLQLRDDADDIEAVWSAVRREIEQLQPDLPDGCLSPNLEVFPLKAYAAIIALKPKQSRNNAAGNESEQAEENRSEPDKPVDAAAFARTRTAAARLRSELAAMPAVESVDVWGDPGEEFLVSLKPAAVAAMNLPVAGIAQQIAARQVEQPAGEMVAKDTSVLVDLKDRVDSVRALEQLSIRHGVRGESSPLGEFAVIRRGVVEPADEWALVDGRPAIVLAAHVRNDSRVDQWAVRLQARLDDFRTTYGDVAEVDVLFSQSEYISTRLETLLMNLLIGAGGVCLVVLLMMGWRSMIVVAAALPLSALLVLSAMGWLQIPIHQMSVTGMIVALGLLIDNAIVIVESVRARMFAGQAPDAAIEGGVGHLAMPLFGSTLTTALAFLPIATLPGPPGEFVGSIAVSVILAISASFLLAMTVTPALQGRMGGAEGERFLNRGLVVPPLRWLYERSLDAVIGFPPLGIALAVALPAAGLLLANQLPEQFFPPSDRDQIQIEIDLPAAETTLATRRLVKRLDRLVANHPQVARAHWFIGRSGPTFYYNVVPRRRKSANYAQAIVQLQGSIDPAELVRVLQEQLDDEATAARVVVRQLEQGPPFDAPIEVRLSGPQLATLHELGSQVRLVLGETPYVVHTRSDSVESTPKLSVEVREGELELTGLSERDIAQQLYASLQGLWAGSILVGEEELPIRVRLGGDDLPPQERLGSLPIKVPRSEPPNSPLNAPPAPMRHPPLSALADFHLRAEPAAIIRIDGRRTNEINAYLQAGVLPSEVLESFQQRLDESGFALPSNYELTFGGENAERANAVQNLIANAVVLFLLMLLALVVSFRSFRCTAIITIVGALAIGLGPLALACFGYPFGFMAVVGAMGLVGVAINDSIVVLAAIRENAARPEPERESVRDVVVASTRHVIATTLTTVVGFVPLIAGGGGFWPPLAVTIAGGVGGATLLALYLVPSLHVLLFGRDH